MNLRRMRRASFFLSLLPSTWFVLLFCCGAMSLSALLSSKDERDKLICRSDPEKNCSSHGLLVTQLPKVRSGVEECVRPSGIVEGKDRRSPGMLFRGRQDERW